MTGSATQQLFVDASVFITLSEIDRVSLLYALDGEVVVPRAVADEISDDPAASHLDTAARDWLQIVDSVSVAGLDGVEHAASHLETGSLGPDEPDFEGDVALLALGATATNPVVVTDDKPLRNACKALGIELSGSIGVVIAAVRRGALAPAEAKDTLVAMDEVGARLSARLLRRAEKLIDRAAK